MRIEAEADGLAPQRRGASGFFRTETHSTGGLLILRVLATMLLSVVPAAVPALTLDARVGFDGYFVPGRWTPVSVTVENLPRADKRNDSPAAFEGAVRILSGGIAGESGPMLFTRDLSVPANDRKHVILYAKFAATGGDIEVELVSKGGRRIEAVRTPRKPLGAGQPLVAYFRTTDASVGLPKIPDLPSPQIAPVEPKDIPDKWFGYDGASLIIVPRMLDKLLNREQSAALHQWVAQGGRLLLVGGRHGESYKGSLLEDLLPGTITGSEPYTLEGNDLVPAVAEGFSQTSSPMLQINRVNRSAGSSVYLGSNEIPLLLGARYGSGEVLFLASDWSPRLFQKFPVPRLLATYVLTLPSFGGAANRLETVFPFGDAGIFGLGKASALPDPGLVALVLLSYLAVVGPANFYFLARRKRLELAWVTVPLVVTAFCVVIYGLGSYIRGSSSFLRNYHLVTGRTGSGAARCETLSLAYLPQNRREDLSAKGSNTAALGHTIWAEPDRRMFPNLGGTAGLSGAGAGDAIRVSQGSEKMALTGKLIRQWAYDLSRFDSVVDLHGAVDADLKLSAGQMTVAIRNGTDQPLRNLHLVVGQRAWKIGNYDGASRDVLRPGESVTIPVNLSSGGKSLADVKGTGLETDLDRLVFDAFTATLASGDPLKPDLPSCFLIGAFGKPPAEIEIGFPVGIRSDHTFFALAAPVALDSAQPVDGVAVPSRILGDSAGYFSLHRPETIVLGQTPICFSIPLPAGGGTVALEAYWGPSQPDGGVPLVCEIFDYSRWEWRPADLQRMARGERPIRPEEGPRGVSLDNELFPARVLPDAATVPAHPLTGAVLVKFSQAKNSTFRNGLFIAPPVAQSFGPRTPRSAPQ